MTRLALAAIALWSASVMPVQALTCFDMYANCRQSSLPDGWCSGWYEQAEKRGEWPRFQFNGVVYEPKACDRTGIVLGPATSGAAQESEERSRPR